MSALVYAEMLEADLHRSYVGSVGYDIATACKTQ